MGPREKEESFMRKSSTFGVGMVAVVAALVAAASIFTGASLGATSSPTLAVTAPGTGTAGTAIAGSSINGVFASSSGVGTATGTITFKVFGPQASAPSTCTSGGTTVGTATAAGNGTYHPNAGLTPSQPGNYWWYASYPSDANNNAAASTCGSGMAETVIGKASPTLSVTAPTTGTAGGAIAGSSINGVFGASSGGSSATGTITFTVFGPQASAPSTCTSGGTTVGTATAAGDNTYHSNASFTPSQAGNYWWYVSYPSDDNNNAATSTCGSGMAETVIGKASPTLSVTAPATGKVGTAISNAAITGVLAGSSGATSAKGTITFTVFGPLTSAPTTCTSGGTTVGTATTAGDGTYHPNAGFTPSQPGNYWWYANDPSDANNNAATSTCGSGMAETVVSAAGSAPTISTRLSAGAIAAGGSAYDTASLSGGTSATGTVTYGVFTDSRCSNAASGLQPSPATVTVGSGTAVPNSAGVTFPTPGTYYWHAAYSGDSNNAAATSACERLIVYNAHQATGRGGRGGFICHRVRKHGRHHHRGRFVLVCFRVTPLPFARHGDGDNDHIGNGGGFTRSSTFSSGRSGKGGASGFVSTGRGGGHHHHGRSDN
jgi:hypothetical protein